MRTVLAAVGAALALAGLAHAQQRAQPGAMSDDDYMKEVMKAAPPQVVEQATVLRMQRGEMRTVRKGTNEFTCMIDNEGAPGAAPMCLDPNAMAWAKALLSHGTPPDTTGFVYMLAGDTGASNTDPDAKGPKPDNHWVQTGSHVMVVGAGAQAMQGYPKTADPDPTKPYVMWPGSPYEHLMLPVK
jgi:hypothetical protein